MADSSTNESNFVRRGLSSMRTRLDTMTQRQTNYIFAFCGFFLLIALILGLAGPSMYQSTYVFTYNCQNNSHVAPCNDGVDLSLNRSYWEGGLANLKSKNQFLRVAIIIYNKNYSTDPKQSMPYRNIEKIRVDMEGKQENEKNWESIVKGDIKDVEIICSSEYEECSNIDLVNEDFLDFDEYKFRIYLAIDKNLPVIGDVKITYTYVNSNFSDMQIGLKMFFFIVALVYLTAYVLLLTRGYSVSEWTFEQKCVLYLAAALLIYDNCLFPFVFLRSSGQFFAVLDTAFQISWWCILLAFWLFMIDGMRNYERYTFFKFYLPKFGIAFLYWFLSMTFYVFLRIRETEDPVSGVQKGGVALMVMYAILIIIFFIYLCWLVFVLVQTIADIKGKPYMGTRLYVFGSITLVVILSVVVGIMFGIYIVIESGFQFVYFIFLFNVYTFILLFVYTPSRYAWGTGAVEPEETKRILGKPSSKNPF